MGTLYDKLKGLFRGEMAENEPMYRHTSFGIGGPADIYCRPKDEEDLSTLLRFADSEGIDTLALGNGTNVLVGDGGISGIVIHPAFETIVLEGEILTVGSALSVSDLIRFCVQSSLSGLEFMAGIPGSVGGALSTNSGAFGHWFGERVTWVRGVRMDGSCVEQAVGGEEFAYRTWGFTQKMVIEGVKISVRKEKSETVSTAVSEYMERRRKTQPIGEKSAGCIFKNPENEHAGALVERAGLKGTKRGGAEISVIHANFIVNKGGASAKDVLYLIQLAKDTVSEKFGIEMELEIAVVGRD
ncbi:MAG: UDP-N-acetylmuramate dehydrogenase [bacterium]